ncbi:O-antigen ligase family protein [Lutibacter sp.]
MLSILSTFSPVLIYPAFFVLFSLIIFAKILKKQAILSNSALLLLIVFLIVSLASVTYLVNLEHSVTKQYIKLITNLTFLVSSFYFISQYKLLLLKRLNLIILLLEIIILLSFIQVLINVLLTGLLFAPFTGEITNSSMAYLITTPGVYFGIPEKNIWATKIILISIVYFALYYLLTFNLISKFRFYLFTFFSIFCIIYTFSRTAQAMLMAFAVVLAFYHFYLDKKNIKRYLYLAAFFVISIPILVYFSVDFLRIDANILDISSGHQGDGLKSRLMMWVHFFENYSDFNILGNGILYADYYFNNIFIRGENNFHNVFLNTFVDTGIIGLLLYLVLIYYVFFGVYYKYKRQFIYIVMFPPFFVCINSQYLGYDNDLIVYFAFVYLIGILQNQTYVNYHSTKLK